MSSVILDSSAVLALIHNEPGCKVVKPLLPNAVMSSVNVAEVVGILRARYKMPQHEITEMIEELIQTIASFNAAQAYIVGEIEKINREQKLGLSLADKACVSLGEVMNAPVYTADKAWAKVKILNVQIHLIR